MIKACNDDWNDESALAKSLKKEAMSDTIDAPDFMSQKVSANALKAELKGLFRFFADKIV